VARRIMIAWVSIHPSFVFGPALVIPFAVEAIWESASGPRRSAALKWGLFAGVALAAACINPYGVKAYDWPFRLMAMKHLTDIGEWQPIDLKDLYQLLRLGVALFACALILPLRVRPIRAAIVIALFVMMCLHQRYAMVFAIVTPLLLAEPIAVAMQQKSTLDWRRSARVAILAVGIVGATFGAESLAWPRRAR
jgi:hypothetical protein